MRRWRNSEAGFVLAAVLWLIALAGLGAAALGVWSANIVAQARARLDEAESQRVLVSRQSELAFVLATKRFSFWGLEIGVPLESSDDPVRAMFTDNRSDRAIALDGTFYRLPGEEPARLSLQDARGLINLNTGFDQHLAALLGRFGVAGPEQQTYINLLRDFTDEDDLKNLGGAEAADYRAQGLPPPANNYVVNVDEAKSILGWDRLTRLWEAQRRDLWLTAAPVSSFNPNTAPHRILLLFPGMTETRANEMIAERKARGIRGLEDFAAFAPSALNDTPFMYAFVPGQTIVAELELPRTGVKYRFSVTLDPQGATQPWRMTEYLRLPLDQDAEPFDADSTLVFPPAETLYANPVGRPDA
jgi:hypothetical protein